MKISVGTKLVMSYALIILLMVVIVGFSFINLNRIEYEVNEIVDDAIPLGNAASRIVSGLVDQETGLRGYLVTEDEAFLEPYYAGQENIARTLIEMNNYLDGHPIMAQLIEQAKPEIAAVQAYFEEQIELVKEGKTELAREQIGEGKAQMDAFRSTNEAIAADVAKLTNDAWKSADDARQLMSTILLVTSIIAIVSTMVIATLLIRSISIPVKQATNRLKVLANGDLSMDPILVKNKDEIGDLVASMNQMTESLRTVISGVANSAHNVSAAAQQISASTEEIASAGNTQAHSAQTMNELFMELTTVIKAVANSADQAANLSEDSKSAAESGGVAVSHSMDAMDQLDGQMKELTKDSNRIGEIIEVIDDIAKQTNLLALNAAIEAARAGDQGKGFAVVANEVRKLAERSSEATKQISSIIKGMQEKTISSAESVNHAVGLSQQTEEVLTSIIDKVNQAAMQVTDIAAASEEQAAQAEEVQTAVESIAVTSEQSLASVQETASAAQSLANLSIELSQMVSTFRLNKN